MCSLRMICLLLPLNLFILDAAQAGAIEDQWSAETSEVRQGRTYRSVVTFTYDGKVRNGRALWMVDVRCEIREPRSTVASVVTGSGTVMLSQGAWTGGAPPLGAVYVVEAENDLTGGKGRLEIDNPGCASGVPIALKRAGGTAPTSLPDVVPSGRPWTHNGSEVMIDPETGIVAYSQPKPSLRPVAKTGTVLFRGTLWPENAVQGTAYAFKEGCPPAPYPVRGRYSEHAYRLTLRGPGPVRKGCEVVGYSDSSPHAVLNFKYLLND